MSKGRRECDICKVSRRIWGLRIHIAKKHPQVAGKVIQTRPMNSSRNGLKRVRILDDLQDQPDVKVAILVEKNRLDESDIVQASKPDYKLDESVMKPEERKSIMKPDQRNSSEVLDAESVQLKDKNSLELVINLTRLEEEDQLIDVDEDTSYGQTDGSGQMDGNGQKRTDTNLDSSDDESYTFQDDSEQSGSGTSLRLVVQSVPCNSLQLNIERCLDCLQVVEEFDPDTANGCCRFKGFRKLYTMGNTVYRLEASCFATQNEHNMREICAEYLHEWSPSQANRPTKNLDLKSNAAAIYVLGHVGGYFTKLLQKEKALLRLLKERGVGGADLAYWKVPDTDGARELCDTCSTTIFNLHLFCEHCGFSVCRACIHERFLKSLTEIEDDANGWIPCPYTKTSNERPYHNPYKMRMAYLIPERDVDEKLSTLDELSSLLHDQLRRFTQAPALPGIMRAVPTCHYLFNGDLLLFDCPSAVELRVFQERWCCSRPVIVQNVHLDLSATLWDPRIFMQLSQGDEFDQGGLVNCRSGRRVSRVTLDQFWNGFLDSACRLRDKYDRILYLKLKDFPPKEKFSVVFPKHYEDFCAALPIREYTHPENGSYNLATKLPSYCLPPDLGPKMYTAYEMIAEPEKGTTNLHLDVSDAVNVLVHVTTPASIDKARFYADILSYLESQGVDDGDLKRASQRLHHIGALWTIFKPDDNAAIRSFLTGLAEECTDVDDPIHDQNVYLNRELRLRLQQEHGVRGFTFIQLLGDAVFIPAGAAHQVQNLQCCIKIAEDFVSPEGIGHCAAMSDEFRSLSKDHSNHEDKLQLPNIVAHSVRESVTALLAAGSDDQ